MADDTEIRERPTAEVAADSAEEIRRLRDALEAKTRDAESEHERALRVMAEFENAKKRAAREREDYTRYANESLLRDLLPVLDNFDRALQAARTQPAAAAVTAGVELIQRELLRVLEKYSVVPFEAIGHPFDPTRHEAVARVHAPDRADMTIVGETARGYMIGNRVLRPAMVTVAMPPEPAGLEADGSAT